MKIEIEGGFDPRAAVVGLVQVKAILKFKSVDIGHQEMDMSLKAQDAGNGGNRRIDEAVLFCGLYEFTQAALHVSEGILHDIEQELGMGLRIARDRKGQLRLLGDRLKHFGEEDTQSSFELLVRRHRLKRAYGGIERRSPEPSDDRFVEIRFGVEMIVHGRDVDLGLAADLLDGCPFKTFEREHFGGDGENSFDRILCVFSTCRAGRSARSPRFGRILPSTFRRRFRFFGSHVPNVVAGSGEFNH